MFEGLITLDLTLGFQILNTVVLVAILYFLFRLARYILKKITKSEKQEKQDMVNQSKIKDL